MGTSRRGTLSSCLRKIISRLNHFNLRLRPVGLRPSCLTFGVTSACPMFAIWWLTYLARVGLSPTGIIDLARTHTPFIAPIVLNIWSCLRLPDGCYLAVNLPCQSGIFTRWNYRPCSDAHPIYYPIYFSILK
jgi:hypothetical protein